MAHQPADKIIAAGATSSCACSVARRDRTATKLRAHQPANIITAGATSSCACSVARRYRTANHIAHQPADSIIAISVIRRAGGVARRYRTAILPAHQPADIITISSTASGRAGGVARRDRTASRLRAHQPADIISVNNAAAAANCHTRGVARRDRTASRLQAHQPADIIKVAVPASGRAGGVARRYHTALLPPHQTANVTGTIAGTAVIRQVVDQAEVADGSTGFRTAKEPDVSLIAADGEVADGAAVAVEGGGKGIRFIADGLPATSARLIDRKVIGLAVTLIEAEPLVAAARPGAAIVIDVKVQVPCQFITNATPRGRTA